jgi:hypothetical protein
MGSCRLTDDRSQPRAIYPLMDFSVLTEATRDRILAAARVSKTILGTAESDTNRATADLLTTVRDANIAAHRGRRASLAIKRTAACTIWRESNRPR